MDLKRRMLKKDNLATMSSKSSIRRSAHGSVCGGPRLLFFVRESVVATTSITTNVECVRG